MAEKNQAMIEDQERELRNPYVDFTNSVNLAVQTGSRNIAQQVDDFQRAGRAILVSRANAIPEIPGMPIYADPLEIELLRREVDGEILVARKRLEEDQQKAIEQAAQQATKNAEELKRIKDVKKAQGAEETPS